MVCPSSDLLFYACIFIFIFIFCTRQWLILNNLLDGVHHFLKKYRRIFLWNSFEISFEIVGQCSKGAHKGILKDFFLYISSLFWNKEYEYDSFLWPVILCITSIGNFFTIYELKSYFSAPWDRRFVRNLKELNPLENFYTWSFESKECPSENPTKFLGLVQI